MTATSIRDFSQQVTQRFVLSNISWQTYKSMLADLGDHRSVLLAYDKGNLEITMPSDLHEITKHLLERVVITLTEELNLPVKGVGSVTLDREDLQQGAEPDAGFYIQNAKRIRGKRIDLAKDPPPDLVVEVDITNPSKHRLSIYKNLGVPEVWRYTKKTMELYQLQAEEYIPCDYSSTFPFVSASVINELLQQAESMEDDNAIIRSFRNWIQEQLRSQSSGS